MRLFLQELKKFFQLWPTTLAIALWLVYCVWSSLGGGYSALYKTMHTEDYPAHYTGNDTEYSVELQFTDMLLEEYSPSIEREELPRMQAELDRMTQQILDAAAKDEVFQRYHITVNPDLTYNEPEYSAPPIMDETDTSSSFAPYQSEEDYYYVLSYRDGELKFDTMDEPVYFAQALQDLIPLLTEKAAHTTDEALYFVMSDTILYHLSELLMPVCVAVIVGMVCLTLPYAILENQNRTPQLLCSTKTGRWVLGYRFGTVSAGSLLCSGVGILVFFTRLIPLELERYYHIPIRDALSATYGQSVLMGEMQSYSEQFLSSNGFAHNITLLELFVLLCAFLVFGGWILTLLTASIAFHQRNIITAMITGLPGVILEILLFLWCAFSSGWFETPETIQGWLLPPFILLGILLLITLLVIAAEVHRIKRKEVM